MNTRVSSAALVAGGALFVAGGVTHPTDSGTGNKTEQLHEMLVDSAWYPSHALLVLALVGFAIGIIGLRQRPGLPEGLRTLLRVGTGVTLVAVVGMSVHLLEGLNAEALADGEPNLLSRIQTVNETVIDSVWALTMAAVAVVGGWTRKIGNVITGALGLVGGVAFALASATIAFIDTFDPMFALGAPLLALWAIVIGVSGLVRPAERPELALG